MDYDGIYDDGWIQQNARAVLPGGGPTNLVVRADVLPREGQRLDVIVDGRTVASEDVAPGPLELKIPLPESDRSRQVELRWAETARVGPDDPREAAALLRVLDVAPLRPLAVLRLPAPLTDPGLDCAGIASDGWVQEQAHVVLAGGEATTLAIRGNVMLSDQRIEVLVEGEQVASEAVGPGRLDLRLPLPSSASPRRIELRWARNAPIGPDDPREVAALLEYIGVSAAGPPSAIHRFPHDLIHTELEYSGIHRDGWLDRNAWVILRGDAGMLVVRARVLPNPGQRLDVLVEGELVASEDAPGGPLSLRIPLLGTRVERRVELRWADVASIGGGDDRQVAGLLEFLGVVSGEPPAGIRSVPHDLSHPGLEYEGIYSDGWLERDVCVVLAGGDRATLVLRAELPPSRAQHLEVLVDGGVIESQHVDPGELELRIPVAASPSPRRIELRWSDAGPVSARDRREAAALLKVLALVREG